MTKVKICGIQSFKDVDFVNEAMPDYVGFVFAGSRRRVDFSRAYLLKSELADPIQTVGVFVNEDISFIRQCCEQRVIDFVQLHGEEDERYVEQLRKTVFQPVIKAFKADRGVCFNMDEFGFNMDGVDYPLFDSCSKTQFGGTGRTFDWDLVKEYQKPFFLAGGLNPENVAEAIRRTKPYCVDVSSGVETDGRKDRQKILELVRIVRGTNK